MADLFAACWKDEALKARFMSEPKTVLAEFGIDMPDGINVNVVENTDNTVHITMPGPPSDSAQLSNKELSAVSGGVPNSLILHWTTDRAGGCQPPDGGTPGLVG